VTPVLAQVHGDTVGAGLLGQQRGVHRIRVLRAARLPDGGDVVDVDPEANACMVHCD
jgi:hypothetical protein